MIPLPYEDFWGNRGLGILSFGEKSRTRFSIISAALSLNPFSVNLLISDLAS